MLRVILLWLVLIGAGCGQAKQPARPLLGAVYKGDLETVRRLVEGGADVNGAEGAAATPWHLARIRGYGKIAEFLASKGADTNLAAPSAEALVDGLMKPAAREDYPALAVLVARNGETVYRKAFGMADLERKIAATPATRFRIGSVSKQFTAAAILRLQEQGKLNLMDKLSKFFPEFPGGDRITLHHLMTHTSGIHSYTSKPDFMERVVEPIEPRALIDYFKDDPADFEPGAKWSYCNSGYFLLGEIVARAGGMSYEKFLGSEFFAPLKMTGSGVHVRGRDIGPEAMGYAARGGKIKRAMDWDMSWAGGAGALYSTLDDLARWNEGLFGGKVLNDVNLELMQTPVKTEQDLEPGPKEVGYGYGVGMAKERGIRIVSHEGGLNGFSSLLTYVPSERLTVVVLAAALPGSWGRGVGKIGQDITECYLWERMEAREVMETDSTVDPATYGRLAGRYDYGAAGIMVVTVRDGRLFGQLTGQPEHELYPRSELEFFWKVVEASVTFTTNEQGRVTGGVHRQGGAELRVKKLPDLKEVKLTGEELKAFEGEYDYGGGAILTVTRKGGRLFAQLTGQVQLEIVGSSKTNFHWKAVDAAVTFLMDASGKVTGATHEQGGRKFTVKKVR